MLTITIGFVLSTEALLFSSYFTTVGVKKIIHYTEDFSMSLEFHCFKVPL